MNPEYRQPNDENNLYHNDSWDNYVLRRYGMLFLPKSEGGREITADERFIRSTQFLAGRHFFDKSGKPSDFGAFARVTGEMIMEEPKHVVLPEDLEGYMDGQYRVQIDFAASGQPDGPGTEGLIWIARLYDTKLMCEISNTRVAGNKLSWVMSAVFSRMPGYANEVIYSEGEILIRRLKTRAEKIDSLIKGIEDYEKYLEIKKVKFNKRDIVKEVLDICPCAADAFMYRDIVDWVEVELSNIDIKEGNQEFVGFKSRFRSVEQACNNIAYPYESYLMRVMGELYPG